MLLLCLFLAVVLQFMAVGAGVLCARALHMDFSDSKAWDYFAYIGCGHMVAAIPISLMGIGTMEIAYKQFFLGEYGTLPPAFVFGDMGSDVTACLVSSGGSFYVG